MKSFDFNPHIVELEICGEVYQADVSTDTLDYYVERVQPLLEKYRARADDKPSIEEIVKASQQFIDVVLGKGSVKKLLHGRKHQSNDTLDLCQFILEALTEHKNEEYPIPISKDS